LKAFEFNPGEVRLSSRADTADFYKRYGFFVTGGGYMEAGVPHVPMSVTRASMVFPGKCGRDKHFEDFFERRPGPV
jgi:hypothetical protein